MSSCAEKPCLNGASCIEDPSGGTGYSCNCDGTGHRGHHCQQEINVCDNNACFNGGTCFPQPGGFLCKCPSPFTGMRCSNSRSVSNPCLSSTPCQNNGTCLFSPSTGSLNCVCGEGFSGSRCEVDLCAQLNCPANSMCIKGTSCKCLPGFKRKSLSYARNIGFSIMKILKIFIEFFKCSRHQNAQRCV